MFVGPSCFSTYNKNMSTKMIPKRKSRVETIILEERNPLAINAIVGKACEDKDEGIMKL